jgi:hypothetical protein
VRLEFEATAAAAYEGIADEAVLEKIDVVLDGLEKDPGQAHLRMHRWSDPPLWGVTVRGRDDDWLVMWGVEPGGDTGVAVVHYIGHDIV